MLTHLIGNLTPNQGKVSSFKDLVVGYLEQDIDFKDEYTLIPSINCSFKIYLKLALKVSPGLTINPFEIEEIYVSLKSESSTTDKLDDNLRELFPSTEIVSILI